MFEGHKELSLPDMERGCQVHLTNFHYNQSKKLLPLFLASLDFECHDKNGKNLYTFHCNEG